MQFLKKSMCSRNHINLYANSLPRKDKQVNQVFGQAFSWSEAIDAVADIYNGVSSIPWRCYLSLTHLQFVFWSMLTSLGVLVWCKFCATITSR